MLACWIPILAGLVAAADLDHALSLYRQRNFAAAEAELRILLKERENSAVRLHLVRTLIQENRLPDALAELEIVLTKSKDPETMFQAGNIARELAEQRFADLKNVAPHSAPVLESAGRRLEMQGRKEEALKEYQAAAALEPQRPGIHYRIGNVFWRMRRLEDAQKELLIELASSPYHAMANLRLGQVLAAMNEEARAVRPLEFAVQAMPNSVEARKELGKIYRKTGRAAEARREWETVANVRPADDQVHFLLGSLYRELGEDALAAREFNLHRTILERQRALAEKK